MKKAFSLVELLVVIALIGILAAVLIGTFSGSSDSARAARCLSNMRNLAAACQSYGVESSVYPPAGSFECVRIYEYHAHARREYSESKGWISWNSQNAYAKDDRGHGPQSHMASAAWNISAYSTDEEARRFSLTNGVLWKYVSGNHGVYLCPSHVKEAKKFSSTPPNWSYVMNAYFKWDHTKGKRAMPIDTDGIHRYYGKVPRADRRLLFAELQFVDGDKLSPPMKGLTRVVEDSGERCDSVLQYEGCLGCGSPESIGFNHQSGKRNFYAHVCFADGHVEKLVYPKNGLSETEQTKLTKWLCEGIDVSFDGKRYDNMTKEK